jgi:hypothetical protein
VVFVSSVVKDPSVRRIFLFVLCGFLASSGIARATADDMNAVAERYAHLVLALGQHDPDYVDAFYGPAEWKAQAEKEKKSLDAIGAEAAELLEKLKVDPPSREATARQGGSQLFQINQSIQRELIWP